ncbi:hypothetical protein GNI_077200 [Gregarina niphandrodes]|uniref:Uncharacterized protein n=1 Tax=Gregarina niphandrodes TaxID=110365 RepID=A0A023B6U4_GRENI|nr:hypothetical protein GNI_077200 [Gregarina niphandrodes]EZG66714.1 hypothetical protein GNI_077200 [Gregarina niphandrodes]|eukprot:XP_011130519.1 hypothetical protein GNI_077200 [Gregarina niphandrodes]
MRCSYAASEAVRAAGWGTLSSVAVPFAVNGHWVDMVETFQPLLDAGDRYVFGRDGLNIAFFDGLQLLEDLPDMTVGSFDMKPVEIISPEELKRAMLSEAPIEREMFRAVADCLFSIQPLVTRYPESCGVDDNLRTRLKQWVAHVNHLLEPNKWRLYHAASEVCKLKKMHFDLLAIVRIPLVNFQTESIDTFTFPVHQPCNADQVRRNAIQLAEKALREAPLDQVLSLILASHNGNILVLRDPELEPPDSFNHDYIKMFEEESEA